MKNSFNQTTDDLMLWIITIISIIITEFISCFTQQPKQSLKLSQVTSPSPKKKAQSSTKPKSRTTQASSSKVTKPRTRKTAASNATRKASSTSTGNPAKSAQDVKSMRKDKVTRTSTKVGTGFQPTKKSKSTASEKPRSRQVKSTKSNPTTLTAGPVCLA